MASYNEHENKNNNTTTTKKKKKKTKWQLQAQAMRAADHASSHHGIHESSQQPHHHLFSVDQLSRLSTVNRGAAVDQQQLQQGGVGGAAGTAHYDHHIQAETRGDGPKLEDFLGGTSLGGQYSDSGDHQSHHHHHHQQQLEGLYYNAAAHGAASFQAESQSRINVNLPYTHSAGATIGSGSLRDLAPSSSTFHLTAYGSKDGPSPRKSIDTFGQRTSVYRGVTRHRWTGRYEAHLWDNSCRKEGQTRKGRQGGYDKEDKAARAYDLAALKYWGPSTTINFPLSTYEAELEVMKNMTRQEYVASLRRKSSGFSRGASVYRGVTRHHQHGRWQARIGRVAGNKDLYLGTYSTQEEAAEAYDIAAIKFRGVNAVTNFDMSKYDILKIHAEKIHAAALNEQHGQEISFKYKPVDQKLIKEHRDTPGSDALCVQDENHRIVTSGLPTETPGSRLELVSTHDQDHLVSTTSQTSCQYNTSTVPSNRMLLRNLMGLEVLPQDHGVGEMSCSAGSPAGLMNHHHGLPSSAASFLSSSQGYQAGRSDHPTMQSAGFEHVGTITSDQQLQTSDQRAISNSGLTYNQGSHERSDVNVSESPKNSVGESEEASSKNSTFDRVMPGNLPRNLVFSSATTSTVKMNPSYDTNPLSTWIGINNPLTMSTLPGQPANRSHMGSSPIFAHSWTE
ncbi:unnamed protein product [Sphagnum balticum]